MNKQVAYLQKLFYDLWNDFGSAYLIVGHSDRTRIGRRGFTDKEKEQGLVLVFNNKTNNQIEWDSEGNLSCVLAFGPRKEDVFIHHDDLRGVFSPEANVQFLRGDGREKQEVGLEEEEAAEPRPSGDAASQVVSLADFRKNKPKGRT